MQTKDRATGARALPRREHLWKRVALGVLLVVSLVGAGCTRSGNTKGISAAERTASLRQISSDYARDGDLTKARAALDKLGLANPGQLLATQAEEAISEGRPQEEITDMARLAEALGARSPRLVTYLAPTLTPTPVPTPAPPSPTPVPTNTPVFATPTPAATAIPPTSTSSPTAQHSRVIAQGEVNLRGGPGTAYPVVGKMASGQEAEILERNASGDWWRIAWTGVEQAWVAGTVVKVQGPIDTVSVAKNIPTPPPTATPAPTVPAQPTATPKPAGPDFRLVSTRLWGVVENGGSFDGSSVNCGGGQILHAIVLDAAGQRLNGVTIRVEAPKLQDEDVTGRKGPGTAEFVLGGSLNVYVIRDTDGHAVTSDYARDVTTNSQAIPYETLMAAGYCSSTQDCAHFVSMNGCTSHYSWDVVFQRGY